MGWPWGTHLDQATAVRMGGLRRAIVESGGYSQVTSTVRTRGEQARLYRRYKLGLSLLPAAPPGHSKHELGLAVDMVIYPPSFYPRAALWWRQHGGAPFGFPSDPVHFESYG